MKCPRDQSVLRSSSGEKKLLACETCNGSLVHFKDLVLEPGATIKEASNFKRSHLSCPGCETTMHAFMYSGVEVDICLVCDLLWLDSGEEKKMLPDNSWKEYLPKVLDTIGSTFNHEATSAPPSSKDFDLQMIGLEFVDMDFSDRKGR